MDYLVKTTEIYRLPNEEAAEEFIKKAKESNRFELVKYQSEQKQKKAKGEIIDEWVRVTLVKAFNIEAEPDSHIEVTYE